DIHYIKFIVLWMASFVVTNRELLEKLNLTKTELSLDDIEELYASDVDPVVLGAFLGSLRLKERVEEKRVPTKEFVEKTELLRLREAEYKWMKAHPESYPTVSEDASDSFGREMQLANRQMTVVLNVLLTVGATFVFGFVGLQYTHPDLSQETRLIIGLVMATVVLVADAYFLVKTLDE
ncbi:hypothetical protein PFISCL1PPCAC_11003, partial [Pristionchus fissidentatus]